MEEIKKWIEKAERDIRMGEKELIVKSLGFFLKKISRDMDIKKIFLFGSRATDFFREDSDIDLVVVSSDFKGLGFFERCYKMYNYWNLDYPVDFLCYTPEEFDRLKNKITLVREAMKKGIQIK